MKESAIRTPEKKFWWDEHNDRIATLEIRVAALMHVVSTLCKELGFDPDSLEQ
jgi:hypothetical protein